MLNIRMSPAKRPNAGLRESPRRSGENNLAWITRNAPKDGDRAAVLLLGGRTPVALRLRLAQAHARHDLSPSAWSHVAILSRAGRGRVGDALFEISLEPEQGFGFPPPSNGVREGSLKTYRDPKVYPNLCILALPVKQADVEAAVRRFMAQRNELDALELVLAWLAFAWGVGKTGNPLLSGVGIPSATLLEYASGAAGYDPTPGLASRSSCPEAVWQTAKWWHEYPQGEGRPPLEGVWVMDHWLE